MPTLREALALAEQHHEAGNLQATEEICRHILQIRPAQPDALHRLGLIASQKGQLDQAVELLGLALQQQPRNPALQVNLGTIHLQRGQFAEAVARFRDAIRLAPDFPDAHNNLGNALRLSGQLDEAVACCREALRLRPEFAAAWNNQGMALGDQDRLDEAIDCFRAALRLRPDDSDTHNNLGKALLYQGKVDEALASFRAALQLRPDFAPALSNLAGALGGRGELDQALAGYREALRLQPEFALAHSNLLFCLNYHPQLDQETIFAEHCRWGALHAAKTPYSSHTNDRRVDRRLRIGYVSPDLREHAAANFIEPILANHDPNQFEAYCYAEVPHPDAVTSRLQAMVQGWRSTCGQSDAQIAEQIRGDAIDILVDLAGHTAESRLRAFTFKPAPVQVTYLGYPNTTGLKTIDYRLTDAVADPPGQEVFHSEQLIRLPGCFCCYRMPDNAPPSGPLPADQKGYITFGSLHHLAKLNASVIDQWSAILRAVPRSRLLFLRHTLTGSMCDVLRRQFGERGVDADRLELRSAPPPGQRHWHAYQEIDIALDPFPWSGHTTACESLWMGVPVVTLLGSRHAGRMVASVLTALGMTGLIATTPEEYVNLCVDLSYRAVGDWRRLRALRSGLREKMRSSPLCDGATFARKLEIAYRDMWQQWVSAESAAIR